MEYRELFQNSAITSLPMGLPVLVDTSMNNLEFEEFEERLLGNVTDVHVIGLSGQRSFAFSRSFTLLSIYTANIQCGRAYERPTMRMYQISRFSCFDAT